ncbi:RBBP9/YdeN family alpha/beta hydrolase [Salinarimonas ramus]|uniref:Alpha/beta hydrolase n=1 Tax=Salinarimonas ramus TaxID=690164 RepID=A0A917Q9D1_9HYPH|nr:alpha/beta hydrolase [Salinarimonas ramus]GGK36743.1 alpha/beta hydrolase [Salinarimonas ramus]
MRTADCDILLVPGLGGSGPDHWQARWERSLTTARIVPQEDWDAPDLDAWAARVEDAVACATRPVVLVAHSLGNHVVATAAPRLEGRIAGAYLVAPPDLHDAERMPEILRDMTIPDVALPFASLVVASRTDPYCAFERAEAIAGSWGAPVVDAGESGHLNAESGHGPWPEGLMRFAGFLKRL